MNTDKDRKKQILIWIAMAFALFVLLFGLFHVFDTVSQYGRAEKEYRKLQEAVTSTGVPESEKADTDPGIEINLEALKKENPDTVGWIYYPALNINYPIMQDEDNTYYIKRTFEGEKNAAGSLFLDCKNNEDFEDIHSIIYGHNMRNGSMFGDLKEIREEQTVAKNPYFWIFLEDSINTYQIFSYHDEETKDNSFLTSFEKEEDYEKFLQHIEEMSEEDLESAPVSSDKVVTLCTCTSDSSVRFLVHGKLVK